MMRLTPTKTGAPRDQSVRDDLAECQKYMRGLHGIDSADHSLITREGLKGLMDDFSVAYLADRGVSPYLMFDEEVRTVSTPSELEVFGALPGEKVRWSDEQIAHINKPGVLGTLLPWRAWHTDRDDAPTMWEVKWNIARTVKGKDGVERSVKSEFPAGATWDDDEVTGIPLHTARCGWRLGEPEQEYYERLREQAEESDDDEADLDLLPVNHILVVAEGWAKAMAVWTSMLLNPNAEGRAQRAVVMAIPGCWGAVVGEGEKATKRLRSQFSGIDMAGREVVLAWDIDRANPDVRESLLHTVKAFEKAGAIVTVALFPAIDEDPKTGLDDYLADRLSDARAQTRRGGYDFAAEVLGLPEDPKTGIGYISGSEATDRFEAYKATDKGRGRFLAKRLAKIGHRYADGQRTWLGWTGKQFVVGGETEVWRCSEALGEEFLLKGWNGSGRNMAHLTFAAREEFEDNRVLDRAIKRASIHEAINLPADVEFDPNGMLLNCPDAVHDLHNGKRYKHDPKMLMTAMTTVSPDPAMDTPVWDAFLEQVLLDKEANYSPEYAYEMQEIIGTWLMGEIVADVLFVLRGDGGNGKGVFTDLLAKILGSYAESISSKVLTGKTSDMAALAPLIGKRLVLSGETARGEKFDLPLIKILTSATDLVSIRDLYAKAKGYRLKLSLVLNSNWDLDLGDSLDKGTRRRMRILPFYAVISDTQRDPLLSKKLEAEMPGILAWAMEGARRFLDNGRQFTRSDVTVEATSDYITKEDRLAAFLEHVFEVVPVDEPDRDKWRVSAKGALIAYRMHTEMNGGDDRHRIGDRRFYELLEAHDGIRRVTSNGLKFAGLRVKDKSFPGLWTEQGRMRATLDEGWRDPRGATFGAPRDGDDLTVPVEHVDESEVF